MFRSLFSLSFVLSTALFVLPAINAMAAVPDVSAEEYALYMDWMDGRTDERLQKYTDAQKMKKIAKNLGVRVKALKAAIEKVEPYASTLSAETKSAMEGALGETPLKARIARVIIDTGENDHVLAFVQWRCGDARDADKEATWIAYAVGQSAPIVKTVGLWCTNSVDTKLFSAKIARSAAERISKSSIERFASSRYIRLFEDVKRGPHK